MTYGVTWKVCSFNPSFIFIYSTPSIVNASNAGTWYWGPGVFPTVDGNGFAAYPLPPTSWLLSRV